MTINMTGQTPGGKKKQPKYAQGPLMSATGVGPGQQGGNNNMAPRPYQMPQGGGQQLNSFRPYQMSQNGYGRAPQGNFGVESQFQNPLAAQFDLQLRF